jgi:cytoskeletal protein CcmA (bactofilin family)
MAELKYLAHINLNQNELQNAAMQILSSDPSGFEGHLYYNSSSNVLKFHNGTEYVSLSSASGDITGVTAGDGLTGGGSSGAVTLNVVGGDGITANANDVAITAAQTTITSVLNASLVVGRDAHNQIKFSTDDQIIFRVGNADGVTFKASGEIEATSLDISGDADIDGTLETDALSIAGTTVTSTAAELNILDGVTATASELNIMDGVTSTTAELNVLDGITAVVGELNALDLGSTAVGTAIASKAVILDSNKDYTGIRNLTITGELDAATLDISGNADIDGTLEADAITVGGTALNTVIAGVTVANATTAAVATTVTITDNENTNEENALVFTAGGDVDGGNLGLEADGNATYNPSSGTITATVFKGNIDAVDGDFDGTLEADAITVGGTNIISGGIVTTLGTINQSEVNFTTDTFTVASANANDPVLQIKNTTNDANGARLQFVKDKGAAGADGDDIGVILFTGDDAAQAQTDFGKIFVEVGEADNTDEAGTMQLQVAASDGTTTGLRSGLVLTGHKTSNYIDVTLGSGSSSTVTIPGNLTVSGTTTTVNSTTVNLNDHNIVLDSGNSTSAVVNGAGITIEGGSGDDAKINYSTTGPKFELLLGSSYEDLQVDQLIAASLDISGDVDVDGTLETDALSINGTAVSSTAAELNILDGVTASTSELNIMDGVTATTAEINLIDGGTSRGTTAVANGDGFLHNDGGTMRMTNVSKLADLFAGTNISASSSVLSVADAADDTKGVVELATTAEALAGSDTARAVTPAGLAARSFKATIGDGSDEDIAITHNLGTRDVIVQCYDASDYKTVIAEVVRTDANNVTINTNGGNSVIASNDLIVLITKID